MGDNLGGGLLIGGKLVKPGKLGGGTFLGEGCKGSPLSEPLSSSVPSGETFLIGNLLTGAFPFSSMEVTEACFLKGDGWGVFPKGDGWGAFPKGDGLGAGPASAALSVSC